MIALNSIREELRFLLSRSVRGRAVREVRARMIVITLTAVVVSGQQGHSALSLFLRDQAETFPLGGKDAVTALLFRTVVSLAVCFLSRVQQRRVTPKK